MSLDAVVVRGTEGVARVMWVRNPNDYRSSFLFQRSYYVIRCAGHGNRACSSCGCDIKALGTCMVGRATVRVFAACGVRSPGCE